MAYIFRDYADEEVEDISGSNYQKLLFTCGQYSVYFSLIYKKLSKDIPALEKNLIRSSYEDTWPGTFGTSEGGIMKVYSLNDESFQVLAQHVNSLFSWNAYFGDNNPEDLAFYRADKTVFMESIIHEGECYIFDRDNEDVKNIVTQKGWELSERSDTGIYF